MPVLCTKCRSLHKRHTISTDRSMRPAEAAVSVLTGQRLQMRTTTSVSHGQLRDLLQGGANSHLAGHLAVGAGAHYQKRMPRPLRNRQHALQSVPGPLCHSQDRSQDARQLTAPAEHRAGVSCAARQHARVSMQHSATRWTHLEQLHGLGDGFVLGNGPPHPADGVDHALRLVHLRPIGQSSPMSRRSRLKWQWCAAAVPCEGWIRVGIMQDSAEGQAEHL